MDYQTIINSQSLRKKVAKQSLLWFILIYLRDYITFPFADFHRKLGTDLDDPNVNRILEVMFRESAKTSISALAKPLQEICYGRRRFIIFGSDEEKAAAGMMANLIYQLETNSLILCDFGSLYIEKRSKGDQSKKKTVKDFITANDIRVLSRGAGQKVRGLLHRQYRPDMFIGDDMESVLKVNNKDQRDKLDKWFHMEVLPAINKQTGKVIMLGNMIHRDSLMARLKSKGTWNTHWVPLYDNSGTFAWRDRWAHTKEEADRINQTRPAHKRCISVEELIQENGTLVFNQEYMLKPITDEDQIIRPEWINYYDTQFDWKDERRFTISMAVDPAISEKESADYSAISVWAHDKKTGNCYCLDYLNERLSFKGLKTKIDRLYKYWYPSGVIVEDVAAQNWLIQDLRSDYDMHVIAKKRKADKRSRLVSVSYLFENAKVFFRRNQGIIVEQLINFGSENHDDLVDTTIDNLQKFYKKGKTRLIKTKAGGII